MADETGPIMHTQKGALETIESMLAHLRAKGEMPKTHLMYDLRTNSKGLNQYIGFMKEKGLVEETPSTRARMKVKITDKGYAFLDSMKEIRKMLA